ncbi:MAG: class I SAM-dependent methyltransferase [Gammaproteobacteria bacterium]|nr:class I SAM-dependent methyltransferase [Gammaproteobacteria bacterium]
MTGPATPLPPCVLHEDEHVLAVDKPAGWNTHAPAPHAGEGIYEWLRDREPRWAGLAIVHRLDKDTSGVLLFAKTALARRELTAQWQRQEIAKRYVLLTDRPVPRGGLRVESMIVRDGARYVARPGGGAAAAVTSFGAPSPADGATRVVAEPLTGRTHQIRVHAAASGFPVLGDTLYGGTPAARLCLHAEQLTYRDPAGGATVCLSAPADFTRDARAALRAACIDPAATTAWRLYHGGADGWPGWQVDRFGDWLLAQSAQAPTAAELAGLAALGVRGVYVKTLSREVRRLAATEAAPRLAVGEAAPERFSVTENGLRFELGFGEGYSVGLFLDQRDNRRRLLTGHVAGGFPLWREPGAAREVLNAFAYTCGFSVCAAQAGARVTSLDLSRRYLDWGRRNFALNGLDDTAHDFIYGDAFDWFARLARRGRRYGVVVLDPPTFSQSKTGGRFRIEADTGRLVMAALSLLAPGGVLLACANTARLAAQRFVDDVRAAVATAGRRIAQEHYAPQPPDFPVSRTDPAYLKTLWLRID